MQRTSATARIPVFNGEDGQFPFFKTRFLAAVCGLGGHYHAAMEGLPPYDTCEYTSSQITLSPFKTPQKGRTEVKVQAEEVEAALLGHPAISQAAVVGVPDQRWGQAVTAHVISLDPAIEQADLLDYLRHSGSLSPYKLPKTIHFHQTLPTGPTGKVLRRALRDT